MDDIFFDPLLDEDDYESGSECVENDDDCYTYTRQYLKWFLYETLRLILKLT